MPAKFRQPRRRRPPLDTNKCANNAGKSTTPLPSFLRIGKIGNYRNSADKQRLADIISRPITTADISDRIYLLSLDKPTTVRIKEVAYVNLTAIRLGLSAIVNDGHGRPVWVPPQIQKGNWCLDPPCFWKTDSVAMLELEAAEASQFMYNPMADFSLELIRNYRPDIFDALFQRFSFRSKWTHSEQQLAVLKDTIKPQALELDDLDANFSPNSPVAATLKKAKLNVDFLPVIDHYMALLSVRAFQLRHTLMHIH